METGLYYVHSVPITPNTPLKYKLATLQKNYMSMRITIIW